MLKRSPRRVLVHSGFHKTGTSSLQTFLAKHAEPLKPYFTGFGRINAPEIDLAAKAYAKRHLPWRLTAFRKAVRAYLPGHADDHHLVMSIEALSGLMPGHRVMGGLAGAYPKTAIPMARVLIEELRRAFGPETEVIYLFTTREKDDWLRSVHGHLLRSIRMTEDLDVFQARFADLPGLPEQAARIAAALPGIRVEQAALEDYTLARTGPARAVLDLMGVPREVRKALPPSERDNVGQPVDLRTTFLRLNRELTNKAALRARKEALLSAHAAKVEHV